MHTAKAGRATPQGVALFMTKRTSPVNRGGSSHRSGIMYKKRQTHPLKDASKRFSDGIQYSFRMWCDAENYWSLYFDYMEKTKNILEELCISAPTSKVSFEVKQ